MRGSARARSSVARWLPSETPFACCARPPPAVTGATRRVWTDPYTRTRTAIDNGSQTASIHGAPTAFGFRQRALARAVGKARWRIRADRAAPPPVGGVDTLRTA